MPTRQEYDVHSALYEEAVAMYEAAKAEFERFEKLIRATVSKNRLPTSTQLSHEESARAKLFQARVRLSELERRQGLSGRGDLRLSSNDLAITAAACRALAERYREDAKGLGSTAISPIARERAHHAERLAEFLERERDRVRKSRKANPARQ